jgi:hypothetical protein
MRIFHDGRTGSIRIIARDDAESARTMADDDGGDAPESPQPHTRGGRPVLQTPVPTSMPDRAASDPRGSGALPNE